MHIDEKDFLSFLSTRTRLSARSIRTYMYRCGVINRWLIENKEILTNQSVERFIYSLKAKKLSYSGISTYIQTLRHLENYCKVRSLPTGFMEGIESMPKTHPDIVPLTTRELEQLLASHIEYKDRNGVNCDILDKTYLILIEFLATTGCRIDEALSLVVKRLDIGNGRAYLTKTKNTENRFVYFNGPIKEKLNELIKGKNEEDLIFTSSKGTKILNGSFNPDLKKRAKQVGITKPIRAHILRHTFATQLLKAGVDFPWISKLLGHKNIQTTYDTYSHFDDESLRNASNRLPLLQKYADPQERLRNIRELIDKTKIREDERFVCKLVEENGRLFLDITQHDLKRDEKI